MPSLFRETIYFLVIPFVINAVGRQRKVGRVVRRISMPGTNGVGDYTLEKTRPWTQASVRPFFQKRVVFHPLDELMRPRPPGNSARRPIE